MSVVFIAALFFAGKGVKKIIGRHKELKKVENIIAAQKTLNSRLEEEISLAKTDMMYIERLARKELGLIQPGEIEYRFIEPGSDKR